MRDHYTNRWRVCLLLPLLFLLAPAVATTHGSADEIPDDLGTREAGEDWPSFLGPRRDSTSTEVGISTTWPATGLPVVWYTGLGTGYGTCSVARGRCYIFDRSGDTARLRCLHAETGKTIWEYSYTCRYVDNYGFDNGPRTSPVVDGNRVYVFGPSGWLHCVTASSGELVWKLDTSAEFSVVQNFFGVGSTPIVEGDELWVMVGGSPPASQSIPVGQLDRVDPDGSAIVAFDKFTGEQRFRLGDDLASYSSIKFADVAGRRLGLAFARNGLLGFQPDGGELKFTFPWRAARLESVNAMTPIVADNAIFISESYGPGCCLLDVSRDDPQVVWQDKAKTREQILSTHWMTPVFRDGYLFGCHGADNANAEVRCVDWATGEVKWRQPGLQRSTLLYVDGHFICLSEDGLLTLFRADPSRYDQVASCRLLTPRNDSTSQLEKSDELVERPAWSAPVLSHGLLYVRGKGRLVCAELIP